MNLLLEIVLGAGAIGFLGRAMWLHAALRERPGKVVKPKRVRREPSEASHRPRRHSA